MNSILEFSEFFKKLKKLNYLIFGSLIILIILALFSGQYSIPPIDRDESRFAQASSQMIQSGDYVNIKFQDEIKLLEIDNELVCKNQIKKIKKLKKNRNNDEVKKILNKIELCAKYNNKNLLALAVEAAKKSATLGEISFAIEKVYGRYQPKIKSISGIYKSKMGKNKLFKKD